MKTAISIPQEAFDRAARRAAALHMSRSEFFARAVTRYIDELDAQSLTAQIDAALDAVAAADDSAVAAVGAGRRVLADEVNGW